VTRGKYDRSLSPAERWARQRARLMRAVAECAHDRRHANVAAAARRAGVGRNTFYAHFRDFAQARRVAEERGEAEITTAVDRALSDTNTPRATLAALCRAWIFVIATDPRARLLLIESDDATTPTRFAALIAPTLTNVVESARRDGALSKAADGFRLTAATGALEQIARSAQLDSVETAADAAVDALLRMFR
jgi:AcrR family transcriptional regulator